MKIPENLLQRAAEVTLSLCRGEIQELDIILTDDARITELNAAYLSRAEPTDVIAFEAEEGIGELFVSVETAARQAREHGHDVTTELCFLVAHGILHVCGMDDAEPDQRARMLQLQKQVLQQMSLR